MTIRYYGFDATEDPASAISEGTWARYDEAKGRLGWYHGVVSGFTVTATADPLVFTLSPGLAVLPGLLVESDAPEPMRVAAPGTSKRTDYLTLRGTWSDNKVVPATVKGASASAPELVQDAGSQWHMPLARVTVNTNGTTAVEVCKPLGRRNRFFHGSAISAESVGAGSAGKIVSTADVIDPGYPYRLRFDANVQVTAEDGYAHLDVNIAGTTVATGKSDPLGGPGARPRFNAAVNGRVSGVLTGPCTPRLRVDPEQLTPGTLLLVLVSASNHFTVTQYPA